MHGGMKPGDAAHASGFNDYAGFYRAFTKLPGVTPRPSAREKDTSSTVLWTTHRRDDGKFRKDESNIVNV